jgi:hypothetical protein
MGLTTALLEDVRSVTERDLYVSRMLGGNAGGIAPKLFGPILSRKKAHIFTSLPHYSSNLHASYSHLFGSSPGTTEVAAATAPIVGDEVLPHPRLVVSRPRRLNLSLSLNAPPT